MNESFVLDASALLCLLNSEPGTPRVETALPRSVISAVNLTEVVAKLATAGGEADRIGQALRSLHLTVIDFDAQQAFLAGMLRPITQHAGLSLGDRACLALAQHRSATALTADRAWPPLSDVLKLRIETIR